MKIRIDPLDTIFSQYIRMRAMKSVHGCERCLTAKVSYKQLQCSHFIGRGRKSTRWDEDNAAGLCFGCHSHFTAHPLEHVEWFKERLGDKFNLLQARVRTPGRYIDKASIKLYLQAKIKGMTSLLP